MKNSKRSPTARDIEALLPQDVQLRYVDYRDDLSGHLDYVEEAIRTQNFDKLDQLIYETYDDQAWHAEQDILNELARDVSNVYGLYQGEAAELIEEHEEWLRDSIRWRDKSHDILYQLVENTGYIVFSYDVDLEWEYGSNHNRIELINKDVAAARDALSIGNEWDHLLTSMLAQLDWVCNLKIFFAARGQEVYDLMQIGDDKEFVRFTDPMVVFENDGAGEERRFDGAKITLPLETGAFDIDAIHYKYTRNYDLSKDWCAGVGVEFLTADTLYEENWDAGLCTLGDMNTRRHRHVNSIPGSMLCLDCGTFWVY